MLKEFAISHFLEKWENKEYNRIYYGIKLHKKEIDSFLNICPLHNKDKLIKICQRFNEEVPERPNGTVLF